MLRKLLARFHKTTPELAIEKAARVQAKYTYTSVMHDYYVRTVGGIDPYKDHWGFAEYRQKQLDSAADLEWLARDVDEAHAAVAATQAAEKKS